MWSDTLLIVFISLCTALLGEGMYIGGLGGGRSNIINNCRSHLGAGLSHRQVPEAENRGGKAE